MTLRGVAPGFARCHTSHTTSKHTRGSARSADPLSHYFNRTALPAGVISKHLGAHVVHPIVLGEELQVLLVCRLLGPLWLAVELPSIDHQHCPVAPSEAVEALFDPSVPQRLATAPSLPQQVLSLCHDPEVGGAVVEPVVVEMVHYPARQILTCPEGGNDPVRIDLLALPFDNPVAAAIDSSCHLTLVPADQPSQLSSALVELEGGC